MVESTLCCGIIPWYYVSQPSKKLTRFHIEERPVWDVAVSYSQNNYLNSGAREFIQLAKKWWDSIS